MFQKLSKKLRKKQGFTLIELIVVLAILGIILAIAVPNYLGVQETSAGKADENTLDLAEGSVKLWYTSEEVVEASEFWLFPNADGDEFVVYTAFTDSTTKTAATDDGDKDDEAFDKVGEIVTKYLEAINEPKSSANAGLTMVIHVVPGTGAVTASWTE